MALDRDQVGLLFKIDVNSMDARQQLELFQGVVQGMAAETSAQLSRVGDRFRLFGDQVRNTGQQLSNTFGDAARNQLAGFVGQFGLIGDAAAGMIPNLTGSAAAMAGVAGAAVAVTGALTAAALQTANYAGALNDLADVSNLEIDTLQGLNAGAALVGESFESLTSTTVVFQKQIEAAKKGNEDMVATFRALGVDLNGSVDQAFRQTIERLASLEDGSQKTALATELFGKKGIDLLKIMKEMDGSYANLIDKADEFGVKLSKEQVEAADKFGKQLDILKIKAQGIAYTISFEVAKAFSDLKSLMDFGSVIDQFRRVYMPGTVKAEEDAKRAADQAAQSKAQADAQRRADVQADFEFEQMREQKRKEFEAKQKESAGRQAAPRPALVNLPSGDAVARIYDQYLANIRAQEQRVEAEREQLRIAALADEELRIIDAQRRIEESILRVRLQIAQGTEGALAERVLNIKLSNLEQEATATNRKLLDLQSQRVAQEEAYEMDRVARVQAAEERIRAEAQATHDQQMRLNQALQAMFAEGQRQRMESLAADPSSALSIFGVQGQAAADQGAGIFGQISASASEAITSVSQQLGNFSSMMVDAFGAVANGLQQILANFILTGRIGGQAFKALAAQIISAVVAQSAVKAIFELAEGFAANARMDFVAAAQHFTAAKFYGVVAGVAAAASVGLAAIGGGGSGQNGTMFLGQDRQAGSAVVEQGGRRSSEPQVIIIRAETEPGVMVSKFVQDYRSNGEARSVLRRDLLGEF